MEIFTNIVTFFLAGLSAFLVINTLVSESKNLHFIFSIWKRFRFGMLVQCILIILLIVITAVVLCTYIPFLEYGWLNIFVKGGGNITIAPVQTASQSSSLIMRILPPVFFVILLFAAPFLAKSEEKSFRYEHEDWRSITTQSIKFGLVHLIVGIPLAAGIALIFAGLFFGYKYKKSFDKNIFSFNIDKRREEAMLVSTAYHTMYNTILILLLLVVSIYKI